MMVFHVFDTLGVVSCWGDNSKAQLGNGNQTNSTTARTLLGVAHRN